MGFLLHTELCLLSSTWLLESCLDWAEGMGKGQRKGSGVETDSGRGAGPVMRIDPNSSRADNALHHMALPAFHSATQLFIGSASESI